MRPDIFELKTNLKHLLGEREVVPETEEYALNLSQIINSCKELIEQSEDILALDCHADCFDDISNLQPYMDLLVSFGLEEDAFKYEGELRSIYSIIEYLMVDYVSSFITYCKENSLELELPESLSFLNEGDEDEEKEEPKDNDDDYNLNDANNEAPPEEELPSDEDERETQTSFKQEYPSIDDKELLGKQYFDWLETMKSKAFYKIINSHYPNYKQGTIDVLDRPFLWGLVKAISSAITHLAIEAEQKPDCILLFETYYDGLIACLENVVHANSEQDVCSSFEYLAEFLSINVDNKVSTSGSDDGLDAEEDI